MKSSQVKKKKIKMSTTVVFGNITEFNAEIETFIEWCERLEQWFIANMINGEERKRALFLSNIGARGYKLLRKLAQNEPGVKSYEELKTLMKNHLQPRPNEICQRYKFYKRERIAGESVKEYVAELRKLSEYCNFGARLEEALRDKLVCGLNCASIQQTLLSTKDLTLKIAVDTATAMESAARSTKQLGKEEYGGVNMLDKGDELGVNLVKECFRCGNESHLAYNCPFKMQRCHGCKQVGHIRKKCRKAGGNSGGGGRSDWPKSRGRTTGQVRSCNQAPRYDTEGLDELDDFKYDDLDDVKSKTSKL